MLIDPWIYQPFASNILIDPWIYEHVASNLLIDPRIYQHVTSSLHMSSHLLTCKQMHQHVSILVREAGGRLIDGVWGRGALPRQNDGIHVQLQVIISEPI